MLDERRLPPWIMPPDLAAIVAEDGEWEDASWDPLLLTVVGATCFEGRAIATAWQLSLWAADAPQTSPEAMKPGTGKADGLAWADWLLAAIEARSRDLAARVHDDSDADICVLWVETEADGRALLEMAWLCLHRDTQLLTSDVDPEAPRFVIASAVTAR